MRPAVAPCALLLLAHACSESGSTPPISKSGPQDTKPSRAVAARDIAARDIAARDIAARDIAARDIEVGGGESTS